MATTTNKDYYATLGVKKTATPEEIRKAFRKAARNYHPDVNPGDKKAEEKFKEISEANDILSDEKKRKVYDQLGFYSIRLTRHRPRPMRGNKARADSRRSTSTASISPVFKTARMDRRRALVPPPGAASKTFFPASSPERTAAAAARSATGHRSRIPGDGGLLDGDSGRPGAHPDPSAGGLPYLPRAGAHGRPDQRVRSATARAR